MSGDPETVEERGQEPAPPLLYMPPEQTARTRIAHWHLCLHEAGHAAAAHFTGGTCFEMTAGDIRGWSKMTALDRTSLCQIIGAAGPAAEALHRGNMRRRSGISAMPAEPFTAYEPTAEENDRADETLDDATKQALYMEEDQSIDHTDAMRSALRLLRRRWRTVEALAAALFVAGRLDEDQIMNVISRAESRTQSILDGDSKRDHKIRKASAKRKHVA